MKEKLNNQVFIDKKMFEKIQKDLIKDKVLTPSMLVNKFHITFSLSKKIVKDLVDKGEFRIVFEKNRQSLYIKASE
jgi:ribosomal protein S25